MMNREIKFRAWENENGRNRMFDWDEVKKELNEWTNCKDTFLMQFTGLKDKNGKEIYEGDVVSVKKGNYPVNYVIVFNDDLAFRMRFIGRYISGEGSFYDEKITQPNCQIEIIGNIFENENLLNP